MQELFDAIWLRVEVDGRLWAEVESSLLPMFEDDLSSQFSDVSNRSLSAIAGTRCGCTLEPIELRKQLKSLRLDGNTPIEKVGAPAPYILV